MAVPATPVESVRARAFTIPTDKPESDGTIAWTKTTLLLVEVAGGGRTGIGYTYAHGSICRLIESELAGAVGGTDALDPPMAWEAMRHAVRNLGSGGLAAMAISAVDTALWDLKAKMLDLPLATLLGRVRKNVPVYGSGGFTSYNDEELREQLAGWVERDGCTAVKMKVGSRPERDPHRMRIAKAVIGGADLFIDANGAFGTKEALRVARAAQEQDVRWFEEPVSSDDLEGLALIRQAGPPGMDIAAGEYGFTPGYFARMLAAGAVDCLQADATRCGGVTGFLRVAALCEANHLDLSGHCAPAIHLHAACAAPRLRHLEWFHDHARIEATLFDGAPAIRAGRIEPDLTRPGHGLAFREADAESYRIA